MMLCGTRVGAADTPVESIRLMNFEHTYSSLAFAFDIAVCRQLVRFKLSLELTCD